MAKSKKKKAAKAVPKKANKPAKPSEVERMIQGVDVEYRKLSLPADTHSALAQGLNLILAAYKEEQLKEAPDEGSD